MEMIEKTCKVCNKIFLVKRIDIVFGKGKYCSKTCQVKGRTTKTSTICLVCGKEFLSQPHRANKSRGKYCSKECQHKSMKKENSSRNYGSEWDKVRKEIVKRDKYKCVNCGKTKYELGRKSLHVHHKIKRRLFADKTLADNPENLITLCAKCHKKIETS